MKFSPTTEFLLKAIYAGFTTGSEQKESTASSQEP